MKTIIVSGCLIAFTFALITVDFGRRIIACREVNDAIVTRLADINENYWLFKMEP
tara:strand:- start:1773 stop:1937 length:165 start_codon:yes stop_codon:yes gene_type:complete